MTQLLAQVLTLAFLAQAIRISVPYILAALGGVFSERSGVVNIALEGIMLNGAFASVLGTHLTGSPVAGLAAGILCGVATAALHAVVSIRFRADQIVSGVAINLLSVGLTKFFLKIAFDSSSNSSRVAGLPILEIFPASSPVGSLLNQIVGNPLIVLTGFLVPAAHIIVFRTVFGLRLRAAGEHPEAAATLGLDVRALRYVCVLASGALAGMGGAWLALDQHQFTDGMSNGRGFIAIAAVIFGRWSPCGAALACFLFGSAEALQIALQSSGAAIPTQFVQMIPYALTMIALAGVVGRSIPPSALGKVYEGE